MYVLSSSPAKAPGREKLDQEKQRGTEREPAPGLALLVLLKDVDLDVLPHRKIHPGGGQGGAEAGLALRLEIALARGAAARVPGRLQDVRRNRGVGQGGTRGSERKKRSTRWRA